MEEKAESRIQSFLLKQCMSKLGLFTEIRNTLRWGEVSEGQLMFGF